MTYEDLIFDWIEDNDEFDQDWYAGFNDGTEIITYLDEHEDFRIPISDMVGDEIGNILDRFNEKIEEAKEADEPTIFIGTEVPQKEIDAQEEIDLEPEVKPIFFEEPEVDKQILLLQEELAIAREELQELEFEEDFEEQFEMEEEEDKIPVSLFKRVKNFFGF